MVGVEGTRVLARVTARRWVAAAATVTAAIRITVLWVPKRLARWWVAPAATGVPSRTGGALAAFARGGVAPVGRLRVGPTRPGVGACDRSRLCFSSRVERMEGNGIFAEGGVERGLARGGKRAWWRTP